MESKKDKFFTGHEIFVWGMSKEVVPGSCDSSDAIAFHANAKVERLVKAYEYLKGEILKGSEMSPYRRRIIRAEADRILNPPGDGNPRGMNAHFEPLE